MELKLPDSIVLIVEDLDRSLVFYTEALGIKLKAPADDAPPVLNWVLRWMVWTWPIRNYVTMRI